MFTARGWAIHTDWADKNPEQFALLERTSKEAHASPIFREAYKKTGATDINLVYGDRKACTEYAENTISLDGGKATQMLKLIDAMEDSDDVNNVWTNFDTSSATES